MQSFAFRTLGALLAALAVGTAIAAANTGYIITPTPAASAGPDSPVILRVELNRQNFSDHDEINMQVVTSANVVKVTNQELGHGGTLRQVASGLFTGHGKVEGVPFFLKGMHVDMHYTATTESGAKVTVSVPVTF
jgi:hypothetical protein